MFKPNSAQYLKATYHGEETFLRVTASSYNHEDTIQTWSLLSVSYAGINNLTQCHQIWQNKPSWRQEDFLVQQSPTDTDSTGQAIECKYKQ